MAAADYSSRLWAEKVPPNLYVRL